VRLEIPKLKGVPFETAIIERYRRRESSVEEALIEMYLAGVSVRRVEDISEALWGSRVSASTISDLNQKAYVHIEEWRNRKLSGKYPYVYVDGIYLKEAARKKAGDVVEKLRSMRLNEAAKKVEDSIEETLTYMDFPSQHWLKIRTNNVIERMNREIRRRTRVVGTFPDGKSALMLVCARLRYVSGKEWGSKRYLCMKYLTEAATEVA